MAVPDWRPGGPEYLFVQLAAHIKARIEAGEFPPGSRLPNQRDMMDEYDVSIDTVRRALEELQARNLVVTVPIKGSFVMEEGGTPG